MRNGKKLILLHLFFKYSTVITVCRTCLTNHLPSISSKSLAFTEKVKAAVNKRQYCPWTFWWIELTHEFCGGGNGACTVDFFNPRKHNSKLRTIIVFDIVIWVKGEKSISKVVKSHRLLVKNCKSMKYTYLEYFQDHVALWILKNNF